MQNKTLSRFLRDKSSGQMSCVLKRLHFHKAVGEELVEMARHAPTMLSAAKRFKRLPAPDDSAPKLQILQVRELLNKALALSAAPEPESAPAKHKRTRQEKAEFLFAQTGEQQGGEGCPVCPIALPKQEVEFHLRICRRSAVRVPRGVAQRLESSVRTDSPSSCRARGSGN